MTQNDNSNDTGRDELAHVMAKVQYHHSEAAEHIANGRIDKADYQLFRAFQALGDYLHETDEWSVETDT